MSRLIAALALAAVVATASAVPAAADSRRPDLDRRHTAPAGHHGDHDTDRDTDRGTERDAADWWF